MSLDGWWRGRGRIGRWFRGTRCVWRYVTGVWVLKPEVWIQRTEAISNIDMAFRHLLVFDHIDTYRFQQSSSKPYEPPIFILGFRFVIVGLRVRLKETLWLSD